MRVAEPLRFLLPSRHRHGDAVVPVDGTSTVLHVVESLGVPRTEIGALGIDVLGRAIRAGIAAEALASDLEDTLGELDEG